MNQQTNQGLKMSTHPRAMRMFPQAEAQPLRLAETCPLHNPGDEELDMRRVITMYIQFKATSATLLSLHRVFQNETLLIT
jgi:hypothetical protein